MAIDETGKWWKGENFDDLAEYIRLLTAEGYPADEVAQSICPCGGTRFRLLADRNEGCAKRICAACGKEAFIADSEETWSDARPKTIRCPCRGKLLELGVGFALREDRREVKWVTVGQRCTACGVLASYVDWKIDFSPSEHLRSKA
jgi:hypothetical protein